MKTLKIWNGRGWGHRIYDKDRVLIPDPTGKSRCDHAFVCAHSRSHAIRLINQAAGREVVNDRELKNYWHEGSWGNTMEGINQEIGVWTVQKSFVDKPKRIL